MRLTLLCFLNPLDGSTNGTQRIHSKQVAVGRTRTIGASQLLEVRLGLSGTRAGKFSQAIGDKSFTFPGLLPSGTHLPQLLTYSRALDTAGASLESSTPAPQDIYDLYGDYGTSDYDQPIINTTSLVYELPFGRGKSFLANGGVLNQVVGGWQLAAVNQAQSGVSYNITYGPNSVNQVSGIAADYRGANLYRPNRVPGVPLYTLDKSRDTSTTSLPYTNAGAIASPASGTAATVLSPFGNLARNAGRTPSINFLISC